MRVAAIQFKPPKGRPTEARKLLHNLIERAGRGGARLVVCPEMAHTGYLFKDRMEIRQYAEPALEGSFAQLAALAVTFGFYLISGYAEVSADGALYNAARVIDPSGKLVVNYRKRLLYDSDLTWAAPGECVYLVSDTSEDYPLLCTPIRKIALGICMDLNDDRFTGFLRKTQPDLIALPINWIDQGHDVRAYWQLRLLGVDGVLIAANTYGSEECVPHPPTRFLGRSAILKLQQRSLGPSSRNLWPETLAIAPPSGDAVIFADLPEHHPGSR